MVTRILDNRTGTVKRGTNRDGIFGAGVDDGLQQVVKFGDIKLGLHQQLLGLLLHRKGNGCRHLLLVGTRGSTDHRVSNTDASLWIIHSLCSCDHTLTVLTKLQWVYLTECE